MYKRKFYYCILVFALLPSNVFYDSSKKTYVISNLHINISSIKSKQHVQ